MVLVFCIFWDLACATAFPASAKRHPSSTDAIRSDAPKHVGSGKALAASGLKRSRHRPPQPRFRSRTGDSRPADVESVGVTARCQKRAVEITRTASVNAIAGIHAHQSLAAYLYIRLWRDRIETTKARQ